MAAGTAAALVPIRSISRRLDPSSPDSITSRVKKHSRLSADKDSESVTYLDESVEDAGPICLKLLSQLQGIQLGKEKDQFGWCAKVTEADGKNVPGAPVDTNGSTQTIDQ